MIKKHLNIYRNKNKYRSKRSKRSYNNFIKGIVAEIFASLFLMIKGYKIMARRLKTPFGEIDLLVKKNNVLVIVEVKYRSDVENFMYSITQRQIRRLTNSAKWVMQNKKFVKGDQAEIMVRFDAIIISKFRFKHILNAW